MSWEKVKLEQFLKNRKGRYKPNDKAILGLKRIDKIDFAGNIYLSEKPSNTDMILVKKGDLVISGINVEKGSMNIYLGEDDVVATIHYSSYEFDENNIDIEFLKWFLKSIEFKNALKEQVPGGIKTEIKPKHILPLEVFIPTDIEEQKNIVKNLNRNNNSVNDISSELTNQLNLIKQLRQSFLREAMQGKLVSNDTKDGKTGAELLAEIQTEKEKLIKEKKLKEGKLTKNSKSILNFHIPKNWIFTKLNNLFFVTKLAGFEYTDYMKLEKTGDIPVIRAQNVRNLNIETTNLLYINLETSLLLNRCALTKECLLITFIGAGIGDVATFIEKERWHLAPNVAKAEPFENCDRYYTLKYFNYFLISDYGKSEIIKHIKATAQPSLSMETIRDIDIPLPPLEIQERIVSKLDELMQFCDQLENSVKESQKLNEQLLQQVLREALQPKTKEIVLPLVAEDREEYNTAKKSLKICDNGSITILAGYIIKKLSTSNPKDFGRVKLQKMLHLAEYHCKLETELHYKQKVAGPYAWELENVIEPKLKTYRFFDIKQDKLSLNNKVTYTALANAKELDFLFQKQYAEISVSINSLLQKFNNKSWEFCEMISTMYAVWNNRIIKNQTINKEEIKKDFLAWDEKKIKYQDQLDYAIEWMKKEDLVPIGFGKYIEK